MGRGGGGPQGLQVGPGGGDGGYAGPCMARRSCNLVKSRPESALLSFRVLGERLELAQAFESESPLLFSGPGPRERSAELSQLLTPSLGPVYLLTVKSHLTLSYRNAVRDMLGRSTRDGG